MNKTEQFQLFAAAASFVIAAWAFREVGPVAALMILAFLTTTGYGIYRHRR